MEAYSLQAKDELSRVRPKDECCLLAELSALVRMSGTIHLTGRHELSLVMNTENAAAAKKIVLLLKHFFQLNLEILALKQSRLLKRQKYELRVVEEDKVRLIMRRLLLEEGEAPTFHNLPTPYLNKQCCQRAFLRGCFLIGGSVTDPEKKTYHLEIIPGSLEFAEKILYIMDLCGIKAKLGVRKGKTLIYIKDSETITRFLSLIGAHTALLQLEEVRATREMRGGINRLVNCETANINKTAVAAIAQIESIKIIQEKTGLHNLPPKLRELAYLRLDNPEASLKELSEMTVPKSSKSAINHRMRRLLKIADEMRYEGK